MDVVSLQIEINTEEYGFGRMFWSVKFVAASANIFEPRNVVVLVLFDAPIS